MKLNPSALANTVEALQLCHSTDMLRQRQLDLLRLPFWGALINLRPGPGNKKCKVWEALLGSESLQSYAMVALAQAPATPNVLHQKYVFPYLLFASEAVRAHQVKDARLIALMTHLQVRRQWQSAPYVPHNKACYSSTKHAIRSHFHRTIHGYAKLCDQIHPHICLIGLL